MYSYISKIYASDSFATFLIVSRETLIYGCELFSSELSCFTLDTNLLFGKIAKEMILFLLIFSLSKIISMVLLVKEV